MHRMNTRSHGEYPGADCSGAADVEWCVTNHKHAIRRIIRTVTVAQRFNRLAGNIVAINMSITEATEAKVVVNAKVPELYGCSAPDIAGQQPYSDVLLLGQMLEKSDNTGKECGCRAQLLWQVTEIAFKNCVFGFDTGTESMGSDQVAND
jgi:hypothetical protein